MMKVNRRMFLRGAGGFALSIPFLPSLLPRTAEAQAGTMPKRFVAMATQHGGIWNRNMFPDMATLGSTLNYGGHEVRHGALSLGGGGGMSSLSPVLSGDSGLLTATLAAKMNVIQGIDVPWYIAHHTGGHLGNYGRNDGNDPTTGITDFRATIDQIMAWSNTFYPDLGGIIQRSLTVGAGRMSYNWSSPSTREGEIQEVNAENSSMALFNRLFDTGEEPESPRTPVVDRVLQNYQRLRNGNRRISAGDKQRLDDHMDRLSELQRQLGAVAQCSGVQEPTVDSRMLRSQQGFGFDPDLNRQYWQLHNDVVAAAFACDLTRVVSMNCSDHFSTFQGDWHQDVAHKSNLPEGVEQQVIADAHQRFFEGVYLDLISKLDIDEGNGTTILDNSLVTWAQESGNHTHHSFSIPIITAGSAGGHFKTGNYVDYRNLSITKTSGEHPEETMHPGLIHNQWMANCLEAMGVPRAEYDLEGNGTYGIMYVHPVDNWYAKPEWWPASVQQEVSNGLPIIT